MGRMGTLLGNMWCGNSDFHKVNLARGGIWGKKLCRRLNQKPTLQYKWLSTTTNGLRMGTVDTMGILLSDLWWRNSDIHKVYKERSK